MLRGALGAWEVGGSTVCDVVTLGEGPLCRVSALASVATPTESCPPATPAAGGWAVVALSWLKSERKARFTGSGRRAFGAEGREGG